MNKLSSENEKMPIKKTNEKFSIRNFSFYQFLSLKHFICFKKQNFKSNIYFFYFFEQLFFSQKFTQKTP
jgi:hypothetical protein